MKRGGAVAAVVVMVLLGACGPGRTAATRSTSTASTSTPSADPTVTTPDATAAVADEWAPVEAAVADYRAWQPVLGAVEPWTRSAARRLDARVRDAAARSWTASLDVDGLPIEIAHTPAYQRVRVGGFLSRLLELHVRRDGVRVVCLLIDETQCVRLDGSEDTGGSPHLFNNTVDSFLFYGESALASQAPSALLRPDGDETRGLLGMSTVDSPWGSLDCVVAAADGREPTLLAGTRLTLRPGVADDDAIVGTCIDARGLVVVYRGFGFTVNAFTRLRPGVDDELESLPAPSRPYGKG